MKNTLALAAQIKPESVKLPKEKVTEKMTVVGTLTTDLIKLWGYHAEIKKTSMTRMRAIMKKVEKIKKELPGQAKKAKGSEAKGAVYREGAEKMIELSGKMSALKQEVDEVIAVFWKLVRIDFDLLKPSIGICEGGQVVVIDDDETEGHGFSLGQLLASFGLGGAQDISLSTHAPGSPKKAK